MRGATKATKARRRILKLESGSDTEKETRDGVDRLHWCVSLETVTIRGAQAEGNRLMRNNGSHE